MIRPVPRVVEDAAVRQIFADMERVGWEGLTYRKRSEQYARWVKSPSVGQRLTEYMPEERVRVWIKDGPVKEFPRARMGVGRFASLVERASSPEDVAHRALGPSWEVVDDTLKVKPLRVVARNRDSEDELVVAWGPSKDLKHLVWAAVSAEAEGSPLRWHLVVTGTFTHPVGADEQAANTRLARRVGLPIAHIEVP